MALIERLQGLDGFEKIPIHQFWSALKELHHSEVTVAQVKTFFNMDAGDSADFDFLVSQYNAQPDIDSKRRFVDDLHGIFMLAETQTPGYQTTQQLSDRIARI